MRMRMCSISLLLVSAFGKHRQSHVSSPKAQTRWFNRQLPKAWEQYQTNAMRARNQQWKDDLELSAKRNLSNSHAQGYKDGEACRQRGDTPSAYVRVGIDDYCAGFRAGYFVRRNPNSTPSAQFEPELTHRQSRAPDAQACPPAA